MMKNLPVDHPRGRYARVEPSFQLFDHTADMGLRIRAPSYEGLLQPAAQALYAAIGSLVPGGGVGSRRIELRDDDPANLLRDFLTELLVAFEREKLMAVAFDKSVFANGVLEVHMSMVKVDADRSEFHREVKAITYHELMIRDIKGGLEATVIVDI